MFYETIPLTDKKEGGTLTVYARSRNPENAPKTRPAVLVIPGGGYNMVSFREGEPVALRFLAEGFAVFVLSYSVRTAYPVPFEEGCAAMNFIRSNAKKYGVDPHHVCVIGFSAGGHLAGLLATAHADGRPDAVPDAVLYGYPVVTTQAGITHEETAQICSGGDASLRARLSVENRVTHESAPAFIWHTAEDGLVSVQNAFLLAQSCQKCGVPFELHVFERGCHGMSTADAEVTDAAPAEGTAGKWTELAFLWLRTRGFTVK